MIVGRRVPREVTAHEPRMSIHGLEPAVSEPCTARCIEDRRTRATQQMPHRRPVDQSNGGLERTGPVRSDTAWTRHEPALEVRPYRVRVTNVAAERVCLGERDEMSVPIELPQVFHVTDQARIPIVEQHAES